ncbi:hypothetical protein LTR70_009188 [Exophiala xenobiotica]|uniref:Fungal lipase-type domain-containing protein n=1 Tax=Lithohypha guttulata TaxID=1690604 RepID=A0ABR0JXQ7_9EURO|nr:hypothetical protein LTR24_009191 [Lithohypha guttulata]KAK5310843.1 hypothetical protein LTR70_009188 [Exophiala xenobiotica]
MPENRDMIFVGFRGTWGHPSIRGADIGENGPIGIRQSSWFSRIFNYVADKLAPSNYGLADFYNDATLTRIPYQPGTVWKLYSYWGSLILERTQGASNFCAWPRKVAAYWVSRPYNKPVTERQNGHVHLGFWSLWASPEGFAGYDSCGSLSNDSEHHRILEKVLQAVSRAERENRKTEIFVAGHSLGGAVSCFAALDIGAKLKDNFKNVSIFHATFGAPPVGTKAFADYFDQEMRGHQSFAISHCRDMIPQCFAWCGSKWYLGWLGWWGDWSGVGEKKVIYRLGDQVEGTKQVGLKDKIIFGGIGALILGTLFLSSLFAIPASTVWYLRHRNFFKSKENPPANWSTTQRESDPLIGNDVGLHYHSLQRYIDFLEDDDVFNAPVGQDGNIPHAGDE